VPASPGGELDRFSSAYLWSIRHAARRCKYALNAAQVRSVPRTIVLSRRRQGWVRFPPASCDQDRQNNALRSARVTPARGNGARHFTPDATIHDPARHEASQQLKANQVLLVDAMWLNSKKKTISKIGIRKLPVASEKFLTGGASQCPKHRERCGAQP